MIVGRVFGRPTCYQMTGGPIEIAGGGVDNENALMSSLGRPSAFLERLAIAVVRRFDLVVVRGDRAKRFLENRGVAGSVVIITGSIDPPRAADGSDRRFDLIFVGRLTRIKQPEQFVEIVSLVARRLPEVRAVVVGVGPELEMLRLRALELGVSGNIDFLGKRDDVWRLLNRAKVFVLTSRSEGMSIAMAEAMSCGVPAVVADVGELGDLISNGVNGWLVPANDIATYAGHIVDLLTDDRKWVGCSQAAIDSALSLMGVDNVARRWGDCLGRLVSDRRTPTGSCAW